MAKSKTKAGSISSSPPPKRAKTKSSSQGKSKSRTNSRGKLAGLKEREFYNTKFAHAESMEKLGVLDGVKKLFDNIGWVKLLEWVDIGYKSTTIDFLSSLRLEDDKLHFRLFKKDCVLPVNAICQMINAPVEDTFGPNDSTHASFHAEKFWNSITVKSKYESSHLKASHIVHPVLRVTHRLLSCIVDSRGDAGTVNSQELYLLWCMIHPQSTRPNFGKYLCHKLLQVSKSTKGKICCSSVITILARHESLNLLFPPGLEELNGHQYLDMHQMIKMKLLQLPRRGPGHQWLKGGHSYLYIGEDDRDILYLADPVAKTQWTLELEFSDNNEGSEPEVDAEVSSDPRQEYMARFNAVDTELAIIRTDMNHFRGELREMGRTLASLCDHMGCPRPPPPPPLR